jgi:RHS repeat-associated protein
MFGQLIADSVYSTDSGTYTTTYTVYDTSGLPQPGRMANNVYADFSSTGSLETRYLTGPTLDQIFGQVAANGTTTWNLTDSQGSVRQVVGVTGNVLDTIDYDAYGNITSESNASAGSRFKYDGMAWDAALGLYLDHARAYDPADGVFISQDPMSFAAGQSNLSEYVGNGPTDGTDPSGEWGVAGHFWTTYLVAVAAGKSPEEANSLAYYSQLPDQSSIYDAVSNVKAAGANVMANSTGMVAPSDNAWEYGVNTWLHSLHGGAAQPRQQMLSDMIRQGGMSDWQMGFLLHAYGDSFAHTYTNANGCLVAYSWPLGHGPQGHDPDTIGRHTDAYKGYVDQLFKTLGGNASDENAMKMLDQIKLAADWMNQTNDPSVSKFADSDTGEASTMEDLARSSNFGFNNSWWTPTPGQEGTQPGMAFPTQSQVGGLFLQMQDAANAANNAAPAISPMEQWYNNGYDSRNAADLFGGS